MKEMIQMKKFRIRKGSLLGRLIDHELIKNKIYSMTLILTGYMAMNLLDDCTVLLLTLFIGLPVFFAKENVID